MPLFTSLLWSNNVKMLNEYFDKMGIITNLINLPFFVLLTRLAAKRLMCGWRETFSSTTNTCALIPRLGTEPWDNSRPSILAHRHPSPWLVTAVLRPLLSRVADLCWFWSAPWVLIYIMSYTYPSSLVGIPRSATWKRARWRSSLIRL